MLADEEDLTTKARIRDAALKGFALNGVHLTTIRDIARQAGVSPGLVQHHFKNKDALRTAVDAYVMRLGAEALGGGAPAEAGGDLAKGVGDRITAWMRDHHLALLYVVRSVAEGDEAALEIFDGLIAVGDEHADRLSREGLLRDDLDLRWTVLHVLLLNLATALLEPAIERHLDGSFRDADQLERWNRATTELFRHGLFAR